MRLMLHRATISLRAMLASVMFLGSLALFYGSAQASSSTSAALAGKLTEAQEKADSKNLFEDLRRTLEAKLMSARDDWEPFLQRLYEHIEKYKSLESLSEPQPLPFRVENMLDLMEKYVPGATAGIWRELCKSTSPDVRELAVGKTRLLDAGEKPLFDLQLKALDGSQIDIAKLRGRVVLIDFWATWCGPCVAELPNVKAVYDEFHARGFDVVGISLDVERDREKVKRFCAAHEYTWPQALGGNGFRSPIAVQFGIRGIPAMFLLGQDGLLISNDVRGGKLRAVVLHLLGADAIRSVGEGAPGPKAGGLVAEGENGSKSADEDWKELEKFAGSKGWPAEEYKRLTRREKFSAEDDYERTKIRLATEFVRKWPNDPRRTKALLMSLTARAYFFDGFPEEFDSLKVESNWLTELPRDRFAEDAWKRDNRRLVLETLNRNDLPIEEREAIEFVGIFAPDFRETSKNWRAGKLVDWHEYQVRFDDHIRKYGELNIIADRTRDYLAALSQSSPSEADAEWHHLVDSKSAIVGSMARERVALADVLNGRAEVKLQFTAVDGSLVDLAELRGKVVLIDFWATWCKPCRDEIVDLKEVYAKYRERGFEIVGISCDYSDKEKFQEFLRKNGCNWPQYYDGKGPANELARAFEVKEWPTNLLVGKDGKVLERNVHGALLDGAIRKALMGG